MKTLRLFLLLCALPAGPLRAEDEIEKAFRDALYAEEVKGDTEAALKAYAEVSAKFELQRDMAATALYRQAECLRKLGRKDEAAALYNKVLAQYGDKERTAKLSRENLAALGMPPAAPALPAAAAVPAGLPEEEAKELTRLKALAENSPDLLVVKTPNVMPPLETAARRGHTEVVRWLLGKIPHHPADSLRAALGGAATEGHLKVCELLLAAGADANAAAPLTQALASRRVAIARLLLARQADPNLPGPGTAPPGVTEERIGSQRPNLPGGGTRRLQGPPLLQVAGDDSLPAVLITELLAAGAEVNRAGEVIETGVNNEEHRYPETALNAAVVSGQAEKVKLLLAAKADVQQQAGAPGGTPLLNALMGTFTAQGKQGDPPAHSEDIIAALVAAGADWKATLPDGTTALHIAARRGLTRWLEAALTAGLHVNAAAASGYTPLHYAAESGALECVQKLLAAGARGDAMTTDDWKITPLGTACLNLPRTDASLATLLALLDAGASANAVYSTNGLPVLDLVMPAGNPDGRWPEAAVLLTARGAVSAQSQVFTRDAFQLSSEQGLRRRSGAVSKVSPERLLPAFRVLWKAAHWRDNEHQRVALWLDDGEPMLRAGRGPSFRAVFGSGALMSMPQLRTFLRQTPELFTGQGAISRDWTRATITRVKDGKEEVITADLLALAAKAEAIAAELGPLKKPPLRFGPHEEDGPVLEWGDAVSIPWSEANDPEQSRRVMAWCQASRRVDVQIQLETRTAVAVSGPAVPRMDSTQERVSSSYVSNTLEGVEWNTQGRPHSSTGMMSLPLPDLLRQAGVPVALLQLGVRHQRTAADGTMEVINPDEVRHGDLLTLFSYPPEAKLNDDALRGGVWLCEGVEKPFYPVTPQQFAGGTSAPLGGLLLALMAPHPLPFTNVDWENAKVIVDQKAIVTKDAGYTAWRKEFGEKRLLDAWPDLALAPGTILILPPAEKPLTPPPAALVEALQTKLAFDWKLAIGSQPEVNCRWEPRFFKRLGDAKVTSWQDADKDAVGRPLLPIASDLLATHPRAEEFWPPLGDQPANWPTVVLKGASPDDPTGLQPGSPAWLPPASLAVRVAPRPAPEGRPASSGPRQGVLPSPEPTRPNFPPTPR